MTVLPSETDPIAASESAAALGLAPAAGDALRVGRLVVPGGGRFGGGDGIGF